MNHSLRSDADLNSSSVDESFDPEPADGKSIGDLEARKLQVQSQESENQKLRNLRQHTEISDGQPARRNAIAAAKVNLGLKILGKRPDGFHQLDTFMVSIGLFDSLVVKKRDDGQLGLHVLACREPGNLQASAFHHPVRSGENVTACVKEEARGRESVTSEKTSEHFNLAGVRNTDVTASISKQNVASLSSGNPVTGSIPEGDDNLIIRVARAFQRSAGVSFGADFQLLKRIPAGAGLGGASSNAATTLLVLNDLWKVHWSREKLADFSAAFGSDIPFFFHGPVARCQGRGEVITPSPVGFPYWMVVIRPPFALSTPEVFSRLKARPFDCDSSIASRTGELGHSENAADIDSDRSRIPAGHWSRWVAELHNDLTQPALAIRPELADLENAVGKTHPLGSAMSGSGSCYFAIYRNHKAARSAAIQLANMRYGRTYVVRPAMRTWIKHP